CRGHVSSRPLRPHRHRPRRGNGGEMSEGEHSAGAPSSPSPRWGEGWGEGLSALQLKLRAALTRRASRVTLSPSGRGWRLLWRLTFSLLCVSATAAVALAFWITSLGPAPLGEGLPFSTLVVDREGRLLRPFATPDGRWRLPARVDQVDPRYLDMLLGYEDIRFRQHHGVDPLAMLRAGGQLV